MLPTFRRHFRHLIIASITLLAVGFIVHMAVKVHQELIKQSTKFSPDFPEIKPIPYIAPFKINSRNGLIYMQLTVNGVKGNFIVDTGTMCTVVTPEFAKRAGANMKFKFDNPESLQTFVRIKELKIGELVFKNFNALELPLNNISNGEFPEPLDGILGDNILFKTLCTIDYSAHKLLFNIIPNCEKSRQLEAQFCDGWPTIPVELNGELKTMLIDSGSSRSFLLKNEFKNKLAIKIGTEKRMTINDASMKTVDVSLVKIDHSMIGKDIDISFIKFYLNDTHSVLGIDFFNHFILTFDAPNNRIYVCPFGTTFRTQIPNNPTP